MATSVLPQGLSHFGQNPNIYPQSYLDSYPEQGNMHQNMPSAYSFQTNEEHVSFPTPRRWSTQQVYHRTSSSSPNFKDRTPIRHHRPDVIRARSTSRPEVMLAYATEQTLDQQQQQQQQQQQPQQQHSAAEASSTIYNTQLAPFSNLATPSPYHPQQSFIEQTGGQTPAYSQYVEQQENQRSGDYYAMARPELQLPNLTNTALNPSDTIYTHAQAPQLPSMSTMHMTFPSLAQPLPLESTPAEIDIIGSRQKPQCWDHGCNGRQFSTFSNLLRHQREKSGTASKARCPHCGTEFTRTTARNGHLYGGKCKGMPNSGTRSPNEAD